MEAWFTLLIEVFWPKARIVEVYLNIAEMDEGVFGAAAAGRVETSGRRASRGAHAGGSSAPPEEAICEPCNVVYQEADTPDYLGGKNNCGGWARRLFRERLKYLGFRFK